MHSQETLESPLNWKEIQPVSPKWQSTLNIHLKDCCWSWSSNTLATWWQRADSVEKDPDAGKDWGQEEKGVAEDEVVR